MGGVGLLHEGVEVGAITNAYVVGIGRFQGCHDRRDLTQRRDNVDLHIAS